MSLNFEAQPGSAVDLDSNIAIPRPRILPAPTPEDPNHTEYQYSFYRDGHSVDGLGLFGSDLIIEKAGHREWVFILDLGRDQVLNSIFGRIKKSLENEDDDFTFLQGLARGLVMAYQGRTDNDDNVRYVAITKPTLLAARGIIIPIERNFVSTSTVPLAEDEIVLAEAFIPAHSFSRNTP